MHFLNVYKDVILYIKSYMYHRLPGMMVSKYTDVIYIPPTKTFLCN